ncbi:hypothetical protein B0A49_05325 [Cryomyces minteri]|uniref:Uncharacterized protein n=1 Tax=Cryomyces minteri TaxID=331657 RepID=A0A4V5NDZ0_9PEZI|nr:hypothetical protein B0A49_09410 [Cryomyces minteri]TKA71645.1 hypothetical protein B0A49_05325 [Cryomyces minteri]
MATTSSSSSARAVSPADAKALAHRKPCTLCGAPRDLLVRCQASGRPDASTDSASAWLFVCPGACWRAVSGGVVDGDAAHPAYRYGGMWKNRWADVSARMPRRVKEKAKRGRGRGRGVGGGGGEGGEVGSGDGIGEGKGRGRGRESSGDEREGEGVKTSGTATPEQQQQQQQQQEQEQQHQGRQRQ